MIERISERLGCRCPSMYRVVCDHCGISKVSDAGDFTWTRDGFMSFLEKNCPYMENSLVLVDKILNPEIECSLDLTKKEFMWVLKQNGWRIGEKVYCPECKHVIK